MRLDVPAFVLLFTFSWVDVSTAAAQPVRLPPGLPDVADDDPDGHVRWVSHDGSLDLADGLLRGGAGGAGVGALLLLGIGLSELGRAFQLVSCFSPEAHECSVAPGAPAELTWTAIATAGAGLVLAIVGLALDGASGPTRETSSPVVLRDGVLYF